MRKQGRINVHVSRYERNKRLIESDVLLRAGLFARWGATCRWMFGTKFAVLTFAIYLEIESAQSHDTKFPLTCSSGYTKPPLKY